MKRTAPHLSDQILPRSLRALIARDCATTAELLDHIAEMDHRKLYLPAGYPSMISYCEGELHLCRQAAFKRIAVARAAVRFPAIFDAIAEGRLHLSAVVLLLPYLTEDTAGELLTAATHKTRSEIEELLAERFPKPDLLAWAEPVPPATSTHRSPCQLSPGRVGTPVEELRVDERARCKPLSAESFAVQLTISRKGHENLRYAQALLGRQVRPGDIGEVIERSLALLVKQLEKQRFAATTRPRRGQRRPTTGTRHVPAHVRRAVWERDQGRCTFVSEEGHRCPAETDLEFDHVLEVARGGEATVEGIRLLCRAHNQYAAERTFGAGFMRHQRIAAAEQRATARADAAATAHASARPRTGTAASRPQATDQSPDPPPNQPDERDVVPWLRALGFSAAEARRAAERCEDLPGASLEQRVCVALSCFRVRGTRVGATPGGVRTVAPAAP